MKFYDRESEVASMMFMQERAFSDHSRLTVITGRRRIGKTSLMLEACKGQPTVYLFVTRDNEAVLCENFRQGVEKGLGLPVPPGITRFRGLFQLLLNEGRERPFNLIIDEFQDFQYVNPAVFSDVQELWDLCKDETHVNLLLSGSVYTMMQKIFRDYKQPLFGRADAMLSLRPFGTDTMKRIIRDYSPGYTNDDLLALYMFTGGVPKYVSLLMDNGAFTREKMIDLMIREDSIFLDEGRRILVEEFGKEYGTYFSILSAIASGTDTQPGIQAVLGNRSAGGLLQRLIEDYGLIRRKRPIFSEEGTQKVRFEISDQFLRFWFRYMHKNRGLVEIGNYALLKRIIEEDYETFSGVILEQYFRTRFIESQLYRNIGGWWDPKGYIDKKGKHQQCELDIVTEDPVGNVLEIYEVKRNPEKYRRALLKEKSEHFLVKEKKARGFKVKLERLSLEDM